MSRDRRNSKQMRNRDKGGSHVSHEVGDAVDIEQACHAVNRINRRKREERAVARKKSRPITLPSHETLRRLLDEE